ncbi:(2Fe-2S) ferredoxin domain-containing protein [Methylorubrum sp. Q1]|uniref:(2Fe-2S) ferredoxin domain-containing protein n=1 Tax=Methylorubrum sp. Q1 TaxID=2562453 RepID=UPI001075FF83|nr:(2Fe-2S) ferredoxin domain-containing protein [Methylorubrum sp. Q1]
MGRRQDPGGAAREDRVESDRVETTKVRTAKAGFSDLVLVCRKCAKRQGVDRKQLGRAVKRAFRQGARDDGASRGAGKVRVLETGCLGPCPKRMLTLATPESLARRRVILVDPTLDAIGPAALTLATVVPPPAAPVVVFEMSEASPAAPADGAANG